MGDSCKHAYESVRMEGGDLPPYATRGKEEEASATRDQLPDAVATHEQRTA